MARGAEDVATAQAKQKSKTIAAEIDAELARQIKTFAAANGLSMVEMFTTVFSDYLDRNSDRMPVMPAGR